MKKIIILCTCILLLCACDNRKKVLEKNDSGVVYEIFVGSFNDSDGDGIGDLKGVSAKLDYIRAMGVEYIWLMPINISPSYHKYDVVDYYQIDPKYGSMADFEELISKAKEKNIKIIMDLVVNHTSNDHQWFKTAVKQQLASECIDDLCNYYNFKNVSTPHYTKINDQLFYESQFVDTMPDLNLANKKVVDEIYNVAKFYLEKGVSGFRLDAVLSYFDNNDQKNIQFIKEFNDYCHQIKDDVYLVAEAWTSSMRVKNYYHSGINSLFDFELSDAQGLLAKSVNSGNTRGLSNYLNQYYQELKKINPSALNAVYLSNHDQGRSSGYFNSLDKKEVAAATYLWLPGMPYIYYGEEVELKGSGKDENKRTYMPWGENHDAKNPSGVDYDQSKQVVVSVKDALKDNNSLLNYMTELINIRNKYPFIKQASYQALNLQDGLLGYILSDGKNEIVIVHNLTAENKIERLTDEYQLLETMSKNNSFKQNVLNIDGYSSVILETKHDK